MTVDEALDFMGLAPGATEADVKTAYREMSQILHPDRFNGNEKLKDRATEQFKRLNEAREVLLDEIGRRGTAGSPSSGSRTFRRASSSGGGASSREAQLQARLNGIRAARTALFAQRDVESDKRRSGLIMFAAGLIALIASGAIYAIKGLAMVFVIWGIARAVGSHMTVAALDRKLDELEGERKACEEELGRL